MFKKIANMLSFGKKKPSKVDLRKDDIDSKNKEIFEEYFHRLPGFPQGIPVIPVEFLIQKNNDLIKEIIVARGMSGAHNKAEVEAKIMSPIRHLAEMTHLLPASEKSYFKLPGGLFTFCLEVSLFSIRYAERRILTRATPEIRKDEESLWAHAAFLNGLFSEAITAISKLSVYAEEVGIEWHPGTESLFEWLQRNNLKNYHIRWSEKEDRSIIYMLAGKAINSQQAEILVKGEKAILKTLLGALNDQTDFTNPLAKINDTIRYKIMERDEWSYADRYGKPLAGMHLEPWIVDAMRHLVQKNRWVANTDNGRIWYGQDGVFLVWPLAAGDMQYQLKEAECPFIPSTQEILADIMLDAGIIQKNKIGGYLFDIGVPVAESEERKHVDALKFARYETLFVKTKNKPIDGNLEIELEEDEDSEDDASKNQAGEERAHSTSEDNDHEQKIESSSQNETQKGATESYSDDSDYQESDSGTNKTTENVKQSQKTNDETIDMTLLFGKKEDPVVEHQETKDSHREEDPDLEALFREESVSSATNQYDDDYAADYNRDEEISYQGFSSLNEGTTYGVLADPVLAENNQARKPTPSGDIKTEKDAQKARNDKAIIVKIPEQITQPDINAPKKKAPRKESGNQLQDNTATPAKIKLAEISAHDPNNEDLFAELMGTSKTKPKASEIKSQEADDVTKVKTTELDVLFGKTKKPGNVDQSGRAMLILDRLKKLPAEYLEARQGGATKVIAIGLKNTKLELKECTSVLKEAGLLMLIDGYETALDNTDKPKSRYFLVKADLLNGK